MKIREITAYLESIAPLNLQESYDNAGLIVGDATSSIKAAIVCLDCTEEVVEEAKRKKAGLIIAHHPIIFKGVKQINTQNYVGRVITKAIRNNIAIYASHTNLDSVAAGVSAKLASVLGLKNQQVLSPKPVSILRKLVVFCPKAHVEKVRNALFKAGAGHIGNYDQCSFTSEGEGTFRALDGANPHVGQPKKLHRESELKLEVIYKIEKESLLLEALRESHPYEEVAYDLIPLANEVQQVGLGIVGELKTPKSERTFLKTLKQKTGGVVRYTALLSKEVKRVAVCGGSGSFLLAEAIRKNADVFVSSDFKYHDFFDAEKRILIADIGHYEGEQYTQELLVELLTKKFPKFAVHLTKVNTNPVNYL